MTNQARYFPKFKDCVDCKFFNRIARQPNPLCGQCGAGEFFEEKPTRRPTTAELMNDYRDFFDE